MSSIVSEYSAACAQVEHDLELLLIFLMDGDSRHSTRPAANLRRSKAAEARRGNFDTFQNPAGTWTGQNRAILSEKCCDFAWTAGDLPWAGMGAMWAPLPLRTVHHNDGGLSPCHVDAGLAWY